MNKKLTLSFAFLFCLGFMIAGTDVSADFDEYKIVGALNETDEQTVFGFDETPYVYLKLPANGQAFTGSFWRDPDGADFYKSTSGTDLERWFTLDNWNTVRKVGEWETSTNYFYTNGNTGFATANFTVTPEPLAMTLFLVGGAPIAVNIYRRRRLLKV